MVYYYIKKQENTTGVRIPVESDRGKMRINTEYILCDVLEFNKLIDAGNREGTDERFVYMKKAAELYQGLIFEDRYYNWADTIQGHYEYRYMELLDNLIEHHQNNGNEQKARFYEEKLKTV